MLEEERGRILTVLALPAERRRRMRSTNMLERGSRRCVAGRGW